MKKALFVAVLAVAASGTEGHGQMGIPLAVEGRLDYAVPVGRWDDEVDEGAGWSVGASLGVSRGLGVYGTFSNTKFGAGVTDDEDEADAQDSGFSVGLTAALPAGSPAITPWIGAGAVFHQLEIQNGEGIDESVGFEVGGGLAISVAPNIRLTPGLGYRRYGVDINRVLVQTELDVSYVTAGVGLNISF